MSNSFAVWLGITITGLIALDVVVFGYEHVVFLGKKGLDLLEWIAFWR
ncbi:MAG: hypothetical protein MK098_14000 [Marinovum sp.]|nr:hypothetical protein [Marinovum sp.]